MAARVLPEPKPGRSRKRVPRLLRERLTGSSDSARHRAKRLGKDIVDGFEGHDLLTSASAISFQILTSIVPFLLFSLALIGFLDLSSVWQEDISPQLRQHLSPAAFTVIDGTVTKVLKSGQPFWLTAGLLLTIWQISGAVRAAMGALNRLYHVEAERSWTQRMLVSTALSIALALSVLAAGAVVTLLPLAIGDVDQPLAGALFIVRWVLAGGFLLVGVGLVLRYGPAKERPIGWVSFGTLTIAAAWVVMSIGFGAYLRYIASYESAFGNLATIVVLMGYIYLTALVFLGGALLDAIVRKRVSSDR
jgi:membrane protein